MASLLTAGAASLAAVTVGTPPAKEALSGVFGSISLTAWICLLLPQLITNYKAQSADGLSMAFLFVWLLGDVANLLGTAMVSDMRSPILRRARTALLTLPNVFPETGALATGLAPTAVALATYFCFADLILITQCLYYNALNARRAARNRRRASEPRAGAPEMTDDHDERDNNTAVEEEEDAAAAD
ncbi:hypothetical protein MAPG_02007 [Magnaporthiopsis poae ATCC 64411]|uniref:Vacuolar membrane PQ loop repeat protein n=1 Tax=Magnaporthiopsis poae (strain ATCC 64411 / 73-15) TaxID=644358 RepID=A0A0C4DQ69_MAGP6|nr:hypothetical protein MAPG_02007 [Magnaporthiopsis poae ATCC 64411]